MEQQRGALTNREAMEPIEPAYAVVWPKAPRGAQSRALAPRRNRLVGARIAFVWDYLFRGEELFAEIERLLTLRFPGVEVVPYDVFGNIHGPDEADLVGDLANRLQVHRIDAVLVGNGC